MSRALAVAPLSVSSVTFALLLSAVAVNTGFVTDDTLRLWAGAVTAGEGNVSIGRIVAGYPTIPFLSTTLIAALTPDGTPVPALIAAVVLGAITTAWFVSFLRVGLPSWAAASSALLIGYHPMFLRVIAGGPADAFFALFLFLTVKGLYDLRARSGTSEVMAVGVALLALAFSHPMGAAIVFALTPFLGFALTPVLVGKSPINIVFALLFPTVFAIAGFFYVSWIFPAAGWSFFTFPGESLANWIAGIATAFGEGPFGWLVIHAGAAILVALLLGAPIVPVTLIWIFRRRPLLTPPLVMSAALVAASVVAVATGLFGDPGVLVVAVPILAAMTITHVPAVPQRLHVVLALLAAGWIGGAAVLAFIDPLLVDRATGLFDTSPRKKERLDTLAAGGVLAGRDGILADSHNAPALIIGRGSAKGVFDPSSEAFALALMLNRLEAPLVVVPNPQSATGAGDKLNKAFPQFYRSGAAGYLEVYRNPTWRVFARNDKADPATDGRRWQQRKTREDKDANTCCR